MTCKDCIHFEVCKDFQGANLVMNYIHKDNAEQCNHFQDKSKIIELPCKIGEDCYKVLSELKIITKSRLKTFDLIGDVIDGLITTDKAEAEAKLKELNNEGEKK